MGCPSLTRAFTLSLTLVLATLGQLALSAPLSLNDAIRYAVEHSPSLEEDRQRAQIGELDYRSSKAKLLPSLDLDSIHGFQWSHEFYSFTQPAYSSVTGTLTEKLYDNGETLTNIQISRLNKAATSLTAIKSRDNLCADVASEYFRYSLDHKLIEVKAQQLELTEKQFRLVNSQYEQGFKTRKDYLQFLSQRQRAEIDYRNAQIDAEKSVANLKNLLGTPAKDFTLQEVTFRPVEPTELDHSVPAEPPPIENTYDVRIAKLQTEQKPFQTSLVERKLYPEVDLSSTLQYTNALYIGEGAHWGGTENYIYNVFLEVKFNLLDWGIRRNDLETARANEMIQENEQRKTEVTAASMIRTLMLNLSQLKDNYLATQQLLKSEEESFGFVKRDYDEGKITAWDLVLSLNNLLDAKVQYFTAQYNLADSLTRYHYYLGDIYAKLSTP